ncbi:uncharacterized protein LOC108030956 [Drosophila biarmipes]|uniref:uncharacterized protein LOC108030956 n=1 Tax=Drosophila biarmipes TaxID=125945 RepID=UPI0007E868DF|nr:uncharacterized protein LOC108030956 [Drosophila biarmipes]
MSQIQGKIVRIAGADHSPLRACTSPSCYGLNTVKAKSAQLVKAPYIVPEPVVTGATSIFKVGGEMAHVGDILANAQNSGGPQPIYRIKPGTHAHIVNYVFVREDSKLMKKIRSRDPEVDTERLQSQRECAITQLQKLTSKHRGKVQQAMVQSKPAPPRARVATPTAEGVHLARVKAELLELQRKVDELKQMGSL